MSATQEEVVRSYKKNVFWVLVILLGMRALVLPLGIDRLVTVQWMTPLVLGLTAVAGGCAFLILFRDMASAMPFPKAATLSAMVSGAIWFLLGTLLGVLAQHVPGTIVEGTAIVEDQHLSRSSRSVCRVKVKAKSRSDGSKMEFCVRTTRGGPIGPDDLRVGEVIQVRLRETLLGTSVESANRVP